MCLRTLCPWITTTRSLTLPPPPLPHPSQSRLRSLNLLRNQMQHLPPNPCQHNRCQLHHRKPCKRRQPSPRWQHNQHLSHRLCQSLHLSPSRSPPPVSKQHHHQQHSSWSLPTMVCSQHLIHCLRASHPSRQQCRRRSERKQQLAVVDQAPGFAGR